MSRGDVPLLTAPLAGLPDEVYFEGHAGFRGLAMVRVEDVPPREKGEVVREHPVTGDFAAAKEKWRIETPTGALFTRNDDGSVELTVAKTTSPAWASWKLPRRELCEIVLDLDEATPGSGVYVADEQGRPQDVVRFFRDSRTGQTTIAIAGAADARSEQVSDPNAGPISFVSPRSWLKLVVGCGILRVWVGPDGRHWAPAGHEHAERPGAIRHARAVLQSERVPSRDTLATNRNPRTCRIDSSGGGHGPRSGRRDPKRRRLRGLAEAGRFTATQ